MKQERKTPLNLEDAELPSLDRTLAEIPPEADQGPSSLPPSSMQFRHTKKESKLNLSSPYIVGPLLVAALALVLVGLAKHSPKVRTKALRAIRSLSELSEAKGVDAYTRPALVGLYGFLKGPKAGLKAIQEGPALSSEGSCVSYVRSALNKRLKQALSVNEVNHLVSCELFQDSVRFASKELEQKQVMLKGGNDWGDLPLQLYKLEITRELNPLRVLPRYSKQDCLRWKATPDCLLRYVDEASLPYRSPWKANRKIFEAEISKQSGLVQAWFHLATGLHARRDRSFAEAQTAFEESARALRDDPFLARELYRAALVNAAFAQDQAIARRAYALRPQALVSEDPKAFLDTDIIRAAIDRSLTREQLELYFNQSESVQRFSKDPQVLKILLSRTQLFELEPVALSYAERIMGPPSEVKAAQVGDGMALLYARLLIGSEKGLEAAALLTGVEKEGYRSAELYHLRGLAQLAVFKRREQKMAAARDFQTALGIERSEDSLLAQAVALLDAGDRGKVEQTLKNWTTLFPKSKEPWYEFAQGLLLAHEGQIDAAFATWKKGEAKAPQLAIWAKLKHNLGEDAEYLNTDIYKRLSLILSPESPLGSLALFGQRP